MAFTGVAVLKQVSDRIVRITGLSLAAAADGTIGLFGDATAGVQLPDAFNPKPYDYGSQATPVGLVDSIEVLVNKVAADADNGSVRIAKAAGPPFQITLTNDGAADTPALEIYVEYLT